MLVPLSMPAVFKAAGWKFGIVCFVSSTVWSYWTDASSGKYLKHPDLKTYPEMAAEAVTRFIFGFGGGGGDDDEDDGDADGGDDDDDTMTERFDGAWESARRRSSGRKENEEE